MGDLGSPGFRRTDIPTRYPLTVASLTTPTDVAPKALLPPSHSPAFTCPSLTETLQSHGAAIPAEAPRFRLKIRQQPEVGLAVGYEESALKNARATPLDPPPICELVPEESSDVFISVPEVSVQARLVRSYSPYDEVGSSSQARDPLISGLQESGFIAPIGGRHEECLFVFAELGVRMPGEYRIRFDVIDRVGLQFHRLTSIYTSPFTVLVDKKNFGGLQPSTELVHSLVRRGFKMRLVKEQSGKKGVKRQKQLVERIQDRSTLSVPPASSTTPAASLARSPALPSILDLSPHWAPLSPLHSHPQSVSRSTGPHTTPESPASSDWPRTMPSLPPLPSGASGNRREGPHSMPLYTWEGPTLTSKMPAPLRTSIASSADQEPFHRILPRPLPQSGFTPAPRQDHWRPLPWSSLPSPPSREARSAEQHRPVLPSLSSLGPLRLPSFGATPVRRSHHSPPAHPSYSLPFLSTDGRTA